MMQPQFAQAVEASENGKLGFKTLSTTYAAPASCPASCPFLKSHACYGEYGPIAWQWTRVCGPIKKRTLANRLKIAQIEARKIIGLSGTKHLRVHTLGDCATNQTAKIIAKAVEIYMARHGMKAFTYTHAWRDVDRASWGKVSVIASCELAKDVPLAKARGYATALVIPEHLTDKRHDHQGLSLLPCPQQTGRSASCKKCLLCLNSERLRRLDITIAFAVHGPSLRAKALLGRLERGESC